MNKITLLNPFIVPQNCESFVGSKSRMPHLSPFPSVGLWAYIRQLPYRKNIIQKTDKKPPYYIVMTYSYQEKIHDCANTIYRTPSQNKCLQWYHNAPSRILVITLYLTLYTGFGKVNIFQECLIDLHVY